MLRSAMMRILLCCCVILSGITLRAQTVTLQFKNKPLLTVLKEIQKQTPFKFVYTKSQLDGAKPVTIDVAGLPLSQALELCFKDQQLIYVMNVDDKVIVVKAKPSESPVNSSERSDRLITGRVMNTNKEPLVGATVLVEGQPRTVSTNANGEYRIRAGDNDKLVFTYVNYQQEKVAIKSRSTVDVVMERLESAMQEVTISTGYQKIEQKYLTGSVTRLKMDSIMQPGLTTVDKMLEGRVPGLIMMQNSGQAGAAPKLRIRGTSTILGTREPLWVVDGFAQVDPVPVSASQINDLDFVNLVGNAISGLNPNDIESIDVLKDAAATILYGVRAANGVIVITTKRGKSGPPTLKYNGSVSYTRRPRYTDKDVYMMTSQERIDVSKEMFNKQIPVRGALEAYERATIDYYGGRIDYDTYKSRVSRAEQMNTDWLGIVTQDVTSANHYMEVSGGNLLSTYYASVGYTDERGVIRGEYNKRYTTKLRLGLNYKKLKADFNIMANKNDRRYTPSGVGVLNFAYATSRAIPLYNEDGSLHYFPVSNNNSMAAKNSFNILNEMDHSGQEQNGSSYAAAANFTYELIRGVQLKADLSYSNSNTDQRIWFEENTEHIEKVNGYLEGNVQIPFGGSLDRQTDRVSNFVIRGQADYNRYVDADKKHLIFGTFGGEMSSVKTSTFVQYNTGYYPERGYAFVNADPFIYTQNASHLHPKVPKITEGLSNLAGLFLSVNYSYDDRYVLAFNTRSDFSNAFGSRSNERFLPTWGISTRWNIDRDLGRLKWVDMAALKLSYGTQGNMLPGQTPYTIIQKKPYSTLHQTFTSSIMNFPNPNLQWEKTDSYSATLEFSFFKSMLSGSISYFYKKTTNVFIGKDVSQVNGLTSYTINGGGLENKGIELEFNFLPINRTLGRNNKRFRWSIDPQLGQIFNKLIDKAINYKEKSAQPAREVSYVDYLSGSVLLNGKAINTFYAYRFKGLNSMGQPVFYGAEPENKEDLEEKYKKMSLEEILNILMVEAGRREPVLQGRISSQVAYGSWSLGVNFAYSFGNKIRLLQIVSGNYGSYRPSSQTNLRKEFVDRWRYPGDELTTNIPGIYTPGSYALIFPRVKVADNPYEMYDNADIRVVRGDYIKLQSANLRYTCTPELCRRMHLKAAALSLSGTNLFTWAGKDLRGQDPTQSGSSPDIKLSIRPVYTFSINVSF